MSDKMALLDFIKCHPNKCVNGICQAAQACQRRLLKQETAYEIPMPNPSLCRGCGDCVRGCPLGAIQISIF